MDISTVSLLANQLQSLDTKGTATKDTLTQQANQILQKNADLPLELAAQSTPSATPSSANEVMAHLLSSAVSEVSSKSAIYEVLKNNQLFKNMGNFSEDLKALSSSIKLDSNLTQPLALLQLFTKNIETIDTKMLQNQVQNSGIFFESKLAKLVTNEGAQETIQTLTQAIKEHLSTAPATQSSVSKELGAALNQLLNSESLSTKEAQATLKTILDTFRQSVKQVVSTPTTPLPQLATLQTVEKLEYAIKQMDLMNSKVQNYPPSMKVDENFTTQVKVYLELLKEALPSLQLDEHLTTPINQLLSKESLLQGGFEKPIITPETPVMKTLAPSTASEPIAATEHDNVASSKPLPTEATKESHRVEEEIKGISSAINPTQTLSSLPSEQAPQSVEEALKMVVNRIKQQIELLDPKSVEHANFTAHSKELDKSIHSLIKPELFVGKALAQKLALDPTDVELLSDMKGVLTKLNDALANSPHNKEAYEISNRLLTQVEYHQLFSYVSSSTHVYIPFTWEGLNGGSMMMKQSSDENFHCQIDLDLEHYGKVNMMLVLSNEKYIDMTFAIQKSELKAKFSDQLHYLKRAMNEVGLVTGAMKMLDFKEVETVKKDYFNGEQIQFGINYKI